MQARRPTIRELEEILDQEEDTAIEILPNGEIRALGATRTELPTLKPLTLREDLGGEYVPMDLDRLNQDVQAAKAQFPTLEFSLHPTGDGSPIALIALQTTLPTIYTLEMSFPEYPHRPPAVLVRRPSLDQRTPHRYRDGRICYIHPKLWNPGRHDLVQALARTAKWLAKYEVWERHGRWPGVGHDH